MPGSHRCGVRQGIAAFFRSEGQFASRAPRVGPDALKAVIAPRSPKGPMARQGETADLSILLCRIPPAPLQPVFDKAYDKARDKDSRNSA